MSSSDHIIRGEKLSKLIMQSSFSDAIYLLMRSSKPTEIESKIFASMLVAVIDHGMGTTSSMATRFVASGGTTVNASVAAGILALGEYHGGAIEKAMEQLVLIKDTAGFIKNALATGQTIYGFGHKIYKDSDPRVIQLLAVCNDMGFTSPYIELVLHMEKELEIQKGKKIVLNIDGLMAGILLQMGFSPLQGRGVFVIARTPGLVAQAIEEIVSGEQVRRIDEDSIEYHGK